MIYDFDKNSVQQFSHIHLLSTTNQQNQSTQWIECHSENIFSLNLFRFRTQVKIEESTAEPEKIEKPRISRTRSKLFKRFTRSTLKTLHCYISRIWNIWYLTTIRFTWISFIPSIKNVHEVRSRKLFPADFNRSNSLKMIFLNGSKVWNKKKCITIQHLMEIHLLWNYK